MVTFSSDIDVLNYALTLERFEAALYKALIGTNILTGVEGQYLTTFGAQEQTHVEALTQVITKLGGTPVAAPAGYNLAAAGPVATRDQVVGVLATVEDVGASAYLGAAGYLQSKDLLTAAVTIHAVEGEHAAVWRDLLGQAAAPDAVAKGRTPDEVLAIVSPFLQAPGAAPAPAQTGPVGSGGGSSSGATGGSQSGSSPTTSTTGSPSAPGRNYVRRLGDG